MGGDTFAPDVNGAASFTIRLATGLASRGHDVHIVAQSHDGRQGAFRERHLGEVLTVHRLKSFRWPLHDWFRAVYPWAIHRNARRIIAAVSPDVVHMQSHMLLGRGLATEADRARVRLVATNHFMPENLIEHAPLPRFVCPSRSTSRGGTPRGCTARRPRSRPRPVVPRPTSRRRPASAGCTRSPAASG